MGYQVLLPVLVLQDLYGSNLDQDLERVSDSEERGVYGLLVMK